MATGEKGGGADHPAVKKFNTVDGAKKNVVKVEDVSAGTTYPKGGPFSDRRSK